MRHDAGLPAISKTSSCRSGGTGAGIGLWSRWLLGTKASATNSKARSERAEAGFT